MDFLYKHVIKKLGGLNNKNYLLNYYGTHCVLRVPESSSNLSFKNEHIILNLLKKTSLCPEVIYHNSLSGILLTKYLSFSNLSFETFKSNSFLSSLTYSLNNLHSLSFEEVEVFNPFNQIRFNINYLKDISFEFHHNIDLYITHLDALEQKYIDKQNLALCHNDLNTSNILFKNNTVYFIDFEFSGVCDIFFDLATLSWFLDEHERTFLLKSYFKTDKDLSFKKAKLNDYLFVVKLWNASWSFKKSLTATSDYDYKMGGNLILDSLFSQLET
ncbi:phosphotransferase [Cetobacterium sp.]|uniref:phosphotransferase n=1 Tax=Cetobacterium sp. TaxID=2071632 RepID=UPI003F410E9E